MDLDREFTFQSKDQEIDSDIGGMNSSPENEFELLENKK